MIVVDAVDHPVQPGADAVLGLEVEDDPVQPVLEQGPDDVADEREPDRVPPPVPRDREGEHRVT